MESRELKDKLLGVLVTNSLAKRIDKACRKHNIRKSPFLREAIAEAVRKLEEMEKL